MKQQSKSINKVFAVTLLTTLLILSNGLVLDGSLYSGFVRLSFPHEFGIVQAANQTTTPNQGWVPTGRLNNFRFMHTATLLENGKVLVAGGLGNGDPVIGSAELYDPATGKWSNTGSLKTARARHKATLLNNGQVLIVGGTSNVYEAAFLNSAELYDPATETWRSTGSLTSTGSFILSITLLTNGKVLAVGRTVSNKTSAELYDPAAGTWRATDSPNPGSFFADSVRLSDGKVLRVSTDLTEIYDPDTEKWRRTNDLNSFTPFTLTLLKNGKVLATGSNQTTGLAAAVYDPDTDKWSITGNRNDDRQGAYTATLLPDGRVLIAGDLVSYAFPTNGEELYDPDTGTWTYTSRLNETRTEHTATLLQNGSVLVAGGIDEFYSGGHHDLAELIINPSTIPLVVPKITSVQISGKKLIVQGENFEAGAVIFLNGREQQTQNDLANPQTTLIGKKAGKKVKTDNNIKVRNPNGLHSATFIFN